MNLQELTTWERLGKLDLDRADAAFPFSARLARENGWTRDFAARAIEEYRKFCFLAVHAGHAVTPSDEVDQVWHLHLLYSQHYWDTLCRDTLAMPLHHGPTKGGPAEARKYLAAYEDTRKAYRRYFGEPPIDLWPTPTERFVNDDFVRINRNDVITLDRGLLRRVGLTALLGVGAFVTAHALAQVDAAPAPSRGASLLVFVLVVFAAAMVLAALRSNGSRRRPRSQRRAGAAAAGAGGYVPAGSGASCPPGSGADCGPADGGGAGCGSSGCGGGGCGGGG